MSEAGWPRLIPTLFLLLSLLFGVLAWRERAGSGSPLPPQEVTALRIAVVFLLVGLFLLFYL